MTQQINLFVREPVERRAPAAMAAAFIVVVAIALIFYWQILRDRTIKMEAQAKQSQTQVATEKTALQTMKDSLKQRTDPARLAAELAALKSQAGEAQQIVDRIHRGELGTPDGFQSHLVALAHVAEQGVWLTNVKILNSGRNLELEGRSLQPESVLRYAEAVNKRVSDLGASVTAVEMTPIASKDNSATAIAFKLYSDKS
jgi:hypothetical protein